MAVRDQGRVRLAGREFSLSWVRRYPDRARVQMERARAELGHGLCLCDPQNPLRLVIRRREGRHYLAVWPGEGPRHRQRCPFYDDAPQAGSGDSGRRRAAIEQDHSGVSISLDVAMRTRTPQASPDPPKSPRPGGSRPGRARTRLLGMLHWLWESADLHTWRPGNPTSGEWGRCVHRLRAATAGVRVNQMDLDQVLHVVPPYTPERATSHTRELEAWRGRLGAGERRGLVVGEIREVTPSRYGHQVRLRHLARPLFLRTELLERVRRSFRHAWADQVPKGARRVVLAAVEATRGGHLQVVDLAVMLTNRTYLPADSSHEVVMADALIRAGRPLVKPLTLASEAVVLPDFELLDTTPATCVEVWGMLDDADYAAHQQEKLAHYQRSGTPVIGWDVRGPLPDLCPGR